jgi:integrase
VKDPATGKVRRKQRYESSGSERKSDAQTLLNTKVYESKNQKPRFDLPDPTYEDCRDAWLRYRATKAKPYLLKNGQTYFTGRNHLDAYFGGWRAKNIDTEDIEKFQQQLKDRGLGNGIDRAVAALRAMLRHSVLNKRLLPAQLPRRFPMLRQPRREPQPIDEKFFKPLRQALAEPLATAFVLAYHSGMRLSEFERLRWEHVDLVKKRLYFPGAKTKEWRYVPLLADTPKLLKALKAAVSDPGRLQGKPHDVVFPTFADRSATARAWRHAAVASGCGAWHCRRCGAKLSGLKCPEHGELNERSAKYVGPLFRHCRTTAIRRLTNVGIPVPRIMQMMGHKTFSTSMGYNVADEDDLALIRERYEPIARPKKTEG